MIFVRVVTVSVQQGIEIFLECCGACSCELCLQKVGWSLDTVGVACMCKSGKRHVVLVVNLEILHGICIWRVLRQWKCWAEYNLLDTESRCGSIGISGSSIVVDCIVVVHDV